MRNTKATIYFINHQELPLFWKELKGEFLRTVTNEGVIHIVDDHDVQIFSAPLNKVIIELSEDKV